MDFGTVTIPLVAAGAIALITSLRVLMEYERGVIFRLGKLVGSRGPGLVILIPFVDRMVKVDLRIVTTDVPKQVEEFKGGKVEYRTDR